MPGSATATVAEGHGAPGPCERHLHAAIAWCAPLLRAAVTGLCGLFGLAGNAGPNLPLAIVLVAVATALPCAQSRWHTEAPAAFLAAGACVAVMAGLSQVVLGAQPTGGWLFAIVSITSVTCYFEWPTRPVAGHVLAGLTIAAYSVGAGFPVATALGLVVQALLAWVGLLLVRHAARLCDRLVARAERRRVAAAAERAERTADRAYLAMLHDTASTTLLMVSTDTTGDVGWLPAAARRDLQVLTSYTPDTDRDVDLAGLLGALTDHPGLTVHTDVAGPLIVPPKPAYAIYHGVREALSNVHRHAGDRDPVLTGHDRDGLVVVRVADQGRGFDPDRVPAHRRGLAESIHARMAAVGGSVEVRSAPGRGTTVEWTWSRG